MKKYFKKIILFLILLLVIVTIFRYFFSSRDNFRTVNMVPKDAFMIIETDDPFKTWSDLGNSMIWNHMQKNSFFNELNADIYSTDSMIKENKLMFKLFGSRKILISVHHLNNDSYGVLAVVDMKNLSKLKILKTHLASLDNESYTVTKRDYNEHEIFEIYDREYKEMIYMSFFKNLLVFSYDHLLLEKSLKQSSLPELSRDKNFIVISNQIEGDGQIRFMVNFKEINKLLKFYNEENNGPLNTFLKLLFYGGWKLDINDDYLGLEGYLNGTDSVPNIITALKGTGRGSNEMSAYVSKRTFNYIHLGFSSFKTLIKNLEENLKQENKYEDYAKNRKKIERMLGINIDDDIISWIGDELGIINSKSKYKNQPAEYVLVLKTKNEKEAKEKLNFLNEQIKKNTPVKFKTIEYKNTEINFLAATGLFRLFFGKFFTKLEKPYYMILNDYVYFSNHPQTLKDIIDDITNNNTLESWDEFLAFRKDYFSDKTNIFVFLNTPVMFDELKNNELKDYKKDIRTNKAFIDQLPFIGIQLDGKNDLFYSHLGIKYRDTLVNEEMIQLMYMPASTDGLVEPVYEKIEGLEPFFTEKQTSVSRSNIDPFEIPDIVIFELTKGKHLEYYKDSTPKIEVEIYGGMKHGNFTMKYENGVEKITGKYKNDKQTGTWRFYNEDGDLVEKKKFN